MLATSIVIAPSIEVRSIAMSSVDSLYQLVNVNRAHFERYLPAMVVALGSPEGAHEHVRLGVERYEQDESFEFHVFAECDLCGVVRLNKYDRDRQHISIAYCIAASFQKRGIVTNACAAVLRHAFGHLDIHRVELRCATDNVGSIRVAERLGFAREGRLRQVARLGGSLVDEYVYGLLRSEVR